MKKGVFFTISAIILLMALALLISLQVNYTPTERTVLQTRFSTMNEFVKTVRSDLQRGLYITSFRSVMSMEEYISTKGVYIEDAKASFKSAILTGKINNQSMSLVVNSTFPDWAAKINQKAAEIDLSSNISIDSVSISQKSAWFILVESNVTVNVTDNLGLAAFRLNTTVTTQIPIIGLEDPLFTINTQGKVIRVINSSPFEGNYTIGTNTSNLVKHVDFFYYTNGTGPDFLMRLEGNFNSSPNGIESFVNAPELLSKDLPQYQITMVDYLYFKNNSNLTKYKVNNTHVSWFIIDDDHRAKYQVLNVSYVI